MAFIRWPCFVLVVHSAPTNGGQDRSLDHGYLICLGQTNRINPDSSYLASYSHTTRFCPFKSWPCPRFFRNAHQVGTQHHYILSSCMHHTFNGHCYFATWYHPRRWLLYILLPLPFNHLILYSAPINTVTNFNDKDVS